MGSSTAIAWADSTWSPWIGCTEVSPGCDACYARALDARHKYGGATHWGAGRPRYRVKDWRKPLAWNRKAAESGKRCTVFPSLCDPFDNEVPDEWRRDFWDLIELTPRLTWLLLTKRIGNAARLLRTHNWCAGRRNVWLGASVVNQEEADRDIPKLLATPATVRFVSYEPALGPVDWWQIPVPNTHGEMCDLREIDQIIVGGESSQGKHRARPFDIAWARSTLAQCREAGIACFVKQVGSNAVWGDEASPLGRALQEGGYTLKDRAGADPSEWPEDLRVQEFPA